MARAVSRGDIWQYRFKAPDKRRPVVVLTRQEVIPLLATVTVAPITSAVRGAPSEVLVGGEPRSRTDRGPLVAGGLRRIAAGAEAA